MRKNIFLVFSVAVFAMMFVSCIETYSQENNKTNENITVNKTEADTNVLRTNKKLPILNNMKFITSDVVSDPFINTYFSIAAGTGIAYDLQTNIKNFKGDIIKTVNGDLTYISGGIQFQFACNDWLAINAGYSGGGRLGTNTFTVLSQGISYATSTTFGTKFRISNNKKLQFSGIVDFAYRSVYSYSFYDYIKQAIENGQDSLAKNTLLQEDNVTKTFISCSWAYAPSDWIGFMAIAGYGAVKPLQQKLKGNIRLGGLAQIDFQNVKNIRFPIGISLSARYNSFSETAEDVNNIITYGFSVQYTGHKDFDITIETTYQYLNYQNRIDDRIRSVQTFARVKYYF